MGELLSIGGVADAVQRIGDADGTKERVARGLHATGRYAGL